VAISKRSKRTIPEEDRNENPGNSDPQGNCAVEIPVRVQDQSVDNCASLRAQNVDVGSRIRQEEALIAEEELEIEKIKKEAEEKIQSLNQAIRTRKSKGEIRKELLS